MKYSGNNLVSSLPIGNELNLGESSEIKAVTAFKTYEKGSIIPIGVVALRAVINNRYVTAQKDGNAGLIARGMGIGLGENFTLQRNADGTYSLKARINGRYVAAEDAGNSPLTANRASVGSWEKFNIRYNSDETYSLKAMINQKYVAAENAGKGGLLASARSIANWEKFKIMKL